MKRFRTLLQVSLMASLALGGVRAARADVYEVLNDFSLIQNENITIDGVNNDDESAGGIKIRKVVGGVPTGPVIISMCLDVNGSLTLGLPGIIYTNVPFAGLTGLNPEWGNPKGTSSLRSIQNAAQIFATYSPGAGTDSTKWAGLQLAVWEALYDTGAVPGVPGLNLDAGRFTVAGSPAKTLAAGYLLDGNFPIDGDVLVPLNADGTIRNSIQEFLMIVPNPPENASVGVIKTVACLQPTNLCGGFSKAAAGFAVGTNGAGFCYQIIVTNTGNLTLSNLSVVDTMMGDITTNFFAPGSTLAPGGAVPMTFKAGLTNSFTNVVTVTGVAVDSVGIVTNVTATDFATVTIDTAGIACSLTLNSSCDLDGNPTDSHVLLPACSSNCAVTFNLQIVNTGTADLTNVVVNSPQLTAHGCLMPLPFNLPSGATTNFSCSPIVACDAGAGTIPVTVTGQVTGDSTHCGIYDLSSTNPISVETGCSGQIDCSPDVSGVTGFVFLNCSGSNITSGTGLTNLVVTLETTNGTPVAATNTDSTGAFSFSGLTPGAYLVVVTPPANYSETFPAGVTSNEVTVTMTGCTTAIAIFGYADETTPLFLSVPGPISLGCNPASIPTGDTTVTASDDRGPVPVSITSTDVVTGCSGTRTITYTATGTCGAPAATNQVITWTVDLIAPTVTVPTGSNYGCNPTVFPTIASLSAQVTVTDNCSVLSTNITCSTTNVGCEVTQIFTITATDGCQNTSLPQMVTNTWTISTAPVFTKVPASSNLFCNPAVLPTDASAAAAASATNSCGLATVTASHVDSPAGCTNTRTFTLVASGSCGGSITSAPVVYTWTTSTVPVFTKVPASSNLFCNPTVLPTDASVAAAASATNSCGPATVTASHVDSPAGCTNTRTFTLVASGSCGGSTTSAPVVYTWTSSSTPVFTKVPASSNLFCNPTVLPTDASVAACASATNSCGPATVTASYVDSPVGCTNTRTFTLVATGSCGGSTTSAPVVYTWSTSSTPVFTKVPTGTNLMCNPTVLPTDASVAAAASATNSCGPATVTAAHVDTTNGCIVTRTFTLTATGSCGGSVTAPVIYYWTANTTGPTLTCPPDITISNAAGSYCTFTPADYCAPYSGSNCASILANCFSKVYPNGYLQCGISNTSGYCLKFTSCSYSRNYLACSGSPGCLKNNYSNPSTCEAGNFGAQVLCLKLNVDFGDNKSVTGFSGGCGDLVLNDPTCSLNGYSIRQILGICHTALGGGNVSGYGCTISNLNVICCNLNQCFEGGVPSSWCNGHIVPPTITNIPPSVTGTATAVGKCDANATVTYSDVRSAGACAGTYTIARTWKAVDDCGNVSTCIQNISVGNTKASVCGYVFQDCNGDGHLTPGVDFGKSNVVVTLKNSSGVVVGTNLTDSAGSYCFFNLTAGTYTVSIVQPTNSVQTAGCHTNHWLDNNNNDCWNENDGYQHWKGGSGVDCWTASDGYQHSKNSGGQDCWTDKYGINHTQACTYVSCNVPKNNAETFTLAACQNLGSVNFAYQGTAATAVVCVTGPSTGKCGSPVTYTCSVTNTGNACFTNCQVSACGNNYTCPNLGPGQSCSFQFNYTCKTSDYGNFKCQATASCGYSGSSNPCTAQSSCYTKVGY